MDVVETLEPFRGRRGDLKRQLGNDGLRLLHVHPEVLGSPVAACEFLGYAPKTRGRMAEEWTLLGLQVVRRDYARPRQHDAQVHNLTVSQWREHYLALTSGAESAPGVTWDLPPGEEFGVMCCVSDLHYGAEEMDYRKWLELRDWIAAHPATRFVLLGDLLNTATKGGVSDPDPLPFDVAMELLREDLRPVADQCLVALAGNHEGRIQRELGLRICPVQSLCDDLGIHYGGYDTFLRLYVTDGTHQQTYDGYLHHGFGAAQTPGGKINALVRKMQSLDVDFLAMGHVHDRQVAEQLRLGMADSAFGEPGVNVETSAKPMVYAGSYLRYTQGSYARNKGLVPTSLGGVSLHCYVAKHSVHGRR